MVAGGDSLTLATLFRLALRKSLKELVPSRTLPRRPRNLLSSRPCSLLRHYGLATGGASVFPGESKRSSSSEEYWPCYFQSEYWSPQEGAWSSPVLTTCRVYDEELKQDRSCSG